jgi:hypothetical protein
VLLPELELGWSCSRADHPKVPLSKVAFSPGRIIHTNEFYSFRSNEKKNPATAKIRSYYEAAEELNQTISILKKQIDSLQSSASPVSSPASASSQRNSYEKFVNEQKDKIDNNETYVLPSVEETETPRDAQEQVQPKQPPPSPSALRAVEIRETCDANGKVIDSQLVDLSTEFQSTKSSASSNGSALTSSQEKSLDEVYLKLQERLNLMSETQGDGVPDV